MHGLAKAERARFGRGDDDAQRCRARWDKSQFRYSANILVRGAPRLAPTAIYGIKRIICPTVSDCNLISRGVLRTFGGVERMLGGRGLKVVVVCGRGREAAALGPAAGATCFVRSKTQIKCILLGSTLVFHHVSPSQ